MLELQSEVSSQRRYADKKSCKKKLDMKAANMMVRKIGKRAGQRHFVPNCKCLRCTGRI